MVAPYRHCGDLRRARARRRRSPSIGCRDGARCPRHRHAPQGYNLGWNLGRVAGAGVVDHVHEHVVPRWAGDTNFMPVLADVKVMPEALAETRRKLAAAWPTTTAGAPRPTPTVSRRRPASSIGSSMLDPKVFKAYDVRGIYPGELDEDGAYAIGRAYVEHFEPKAIAVGRDMRLSSPAMAEAAIRGASDGGAAVVDVGMIGTEMLYYAVGALSLDGGLAVTASHNPKEYTGMKIVRRGALPVGGESGLRISARPSRARLRTGDEAR